LFYETPFAESQMGLSAHLHQEGSRALSVKMASPVERRREAIAESFFTERKDPFGESNTPLGEGAESGSEVNHWKHGTLYKKYILCPNLTIIS
jgi:hypothetical protein